MDSASIELLDTVMRALDRQVLFSLATCQLPVPETLAAFFDSAQEDHLLSLRELPPFTYDETMIFITQHSGRKFSDQTKQRIKTG